MKNAADEPLDMADGALAAARKSLAPPESPDTEPNALGNCGCLESAVTPS